MNQQDYTGYIHSKSEQAQSHEQVQSTKWLHQSGSERAQFGSGQVQSHGQDPSGSEKAQSSSTSMAVQMLKNKNNTGEEIKPVDKERQKIELEKSLESIKRSNRVNEEIKESYDKQDAKLKQREEDMGESMRKAEAKYFPNLDLRSSFTDQSKDLDQSNDLDQSKDSDLDSDSSDDFVDVQKPKTNRIRCEECDEEMTRKNYNRHIQSLKHKKNERMYNRNKIIESANEDGIKVTNKDIEQKLDEQCTQSGYTNTEDGIKFCDSCDMYIDNNTAYNKHLTTLKHRNNVRLVNGEIVKNGSKFDCVICKTSLSQYSVDQYLKTKMHLDNVAGKSKDNIS